MIDDLVGYYDESWRDVFSVLHEKIDTLRLAARLTDHAGTDVVLLDVEHLIYRMYEELSRIHELVNAQRMQRALFGDVDIKYDPQVSNTTGGQIAAPNP